MAYMVYVPVTVERKFLIFTMDPETGKLLVSDEINLSAQPWQLCTDPKQLYLYQQLRDEGYSGVASYRINRETGRISQIGEVQLEADACYVATDRTGRFLLAAYLIAGMVTVHPIGDDGAVRDPATDKKVTELYAHSIITDPSNRFAYVPHVTPTDSIHQFTFDETTGKLVPHAAPIFKTKPRHGARHLAFHPHLTLLYSNDEQASSVTVYRFNPADGTLHAAQTISTLPKDGFTGKNSTGSVRVHPTGKAVYVSNRGHNSIAPFTVNPTTGLLSPLGCVPAEPIPRPIGIDPDGCYFFAGGDESTRLSTYRIDDRGALHPSDVYEVGNRVGWVLPLKIT